MRNVSTSTKNVVYRAYGIRGRRPRGSYEMDHLVPLELGGSNSTRNLWPQAAAYRPGFHEKDALENRLHALVCTGRMSLRRAQRLFAGNWIGAYRSYR